MNVRLCAQLEEMKHIHAIFTQRDLLFRQTPPDEIDKGDVIADIQRII